MKKMMKLLASVMALLMALSLVTFAVAEEEGELSGGRMPIGSTPFSFEVPAGYVDIGVNLEEIEDDMISSYASEDADLAFDIYEFAMDEEDPTLDAFMERDCAAYNGTELTLDGMINGVRMTSYRSESTIEEVVNYEMNYAYEYEGKIVEIVFYWQDPASEGLAEEIMSTFRRNDLKQIFVGNSDYTIMLPAEFQPADITDQDIANGLLSAYSNQYSGLEIETYNFENTAGLTVEEVGKAQMEAYNGTQLPETEINGIPMFEYVAQRTFDDIEYTVYVVVVADEVVERGVSAIAFYLNNYCAYVQAEAFMHTLGIYDPMKDISIEPMGLVLGSSGYRVTLPCGFMNGYVTREQFIDEGQIATLYSPHSDLIIDVYQFLKSEEETADLAEFTEIDAVKYDGTEIDLGAEINGIPMTVYRSEETYEGTDYGCLNYTFESDPYFVQLCFYWQGDDLTEDVESIMYTLNPVETKEVPFGGEFTLTVSADTEVENYVDEEYGIDNVYCTGVSGEPFMSISPIANEEGLPFEEFVTKLAEQWGGIGVTFAENENGIGLGAYREEIVLENADELFDTFNAFVEKDGKIYNVGIIVSNYSQYMQAADILGAIKAA